MDIDFLIKKLSKPAQRAIKNEGIETIDQLIKFSEEELLDLHGIGKNGLKTIKETLNEKGLSLASNAKR